MENNNDSPLLKPEPTGGLKLMTVFIAVLALHVVVIVGITLYEFMNGASGSTALAQEKNKSVKVAPEDLRGADPVADPTAAVATSSTAGTDGIAASNPPAATPGSSPAPVASQPVKMPIVTLQPAIAPTPEVERAAPVTTADPGDYTVKSGDSLARIARNHGVTVGQLKSANRLATDRLRIGQKLVLPVATRARGATAMATNLEGTPPAAILDPAGSPKSNVAAVASSPADQAGSPASRTRHYTVAKGDTLNRIAHRFHTSPAALSALNGITDPKKLSVGQKLRLPGPRAGGGTSASNTPAGASPAATPPAAEPGTAATPQLANLNR